MDWFRRCGSANALRRFHLVSTVAWGLLIPGTIFSPLKESITWIALMSVWANFVGHFASYQASRVEVKQDITDGNEESC